MSLDEKYFPDPDVFKPERWLPGGSNEDNNLMDLMEGHVAFGFGRRICPGAGLAVRSLFLVIARTAYFLEIVPKKDHVYDTQSYRYVTYRLLLCLISTVIMADFTLLSVTVLASTLNRIHSQSLLQYEMGGKRHWRMK